MADTWGTGQGNRERGWMRVRSGSGFVASPGMEVRIGTTVGGRAVGFDTSSTRPLLLVGDAGRGKTTTARYLARWWLADIARHAHVFAGSPAEWADLRCHCAAVDALRIPVGRDCRPGSCLVVVDDLDLVPEETPGFLPLRAARVILTACGGGSLAGRASLTGGVDCLGLVREQPREPGEAAVLEGQGRLDWPLGTVTVVPDRRGPLDFPCHRWHAPAGEWAMAR